MVKLNPISRPLLFTGKHTTYIDLFIGRPRYDERVGPPAKLPLAKCAPGLWSRRGRHETRSEDSTSTGTRDPCLLSSSKARSWAFGAGVDVMGPAPRIDLQATTFGNGTCASTPAPKGTALSIYQAPIRL